MSNNRGLAETLPTFTSTQQEVAVPARPKVMRRPAQFTDMRPAPSVAPSIVMPAPSAIDENEDLSQHTTAAPATAATAASTNKPWQDDVRFGIAMLTIVVLVNIALMLWLPNMRPVTIPAADVEKETTAGAVTTPPDHSLTFYTKPGAEPIVTHPSPMSEPVRILGGADSGPNQ